MPAARTYYPKNFFCLKCWLKVAQAPFIETPMFDGGPKEVACDEHKKKSKNVKKNNR